ncbi:TIR domain-containing adapter molecule 1 [Triplophysa rosa]|uniref:TIR domain-containing adapter molecule 1 n=1 Tax=Triplophysa rosa TaxID=992332 RepID=A0A9W7WA21_TRIRA|nr:TIR domain-containing adapter molecule 1 [Triplophysa rosa]KAI7791104.1 TIR domain-containing adapter molecule 1 [Triplophysa rosa]
MAEESVRLTQHEYAEGSGLAEAFEILSQATEERLLSLTYKMGNTCAEVMVHAMCLILLKKNEDAHAKLLANRDSKVVNFLAEMIKAHGESLNGSHVGGFKISGPDVEALLDIARVFAVLVRERLCEAKLRDQAYSVALATSKRANLRSLDVENISEEIKNACGFQTSDEFSSCENGGLKSLDVSVGNVSHPSSLRSSSVCSSHTLEISSPTIAESRMEESKPMSLRTSQTRETCRDQALRCPDRPTSIPATALQTPRTSDVANGSTSPKPKPCLDRSGSSRLLTSKNTDPGFDFSSNPTNASKVESQPANFNQYTNTPQPHRNFIPQAVSEVEDEFYSFVILHEPEDADEAQRLKNKLEGIISGVGVTFSEFEEPGRSTLCCMEDAINNSAFTLLLLTRNFNTNLSETSTDSAIFNSLEKHHKRHSVIPLLPQENCLPKDRRRLVLRGTVPLDESSRTFERAALRAMAPMRVAIQREVWMKEQRIKKATEERRRLQEDRSRNMDLRRETERLARLRFETDMSGSTPVYHAAMDQGRGPMPMHAAAQPGAWQQPSCIHIGNAQNVMIGNNSTMNIDHVQHSSEEDD